MPLSFDPTQDREYTEDQARELWTEARRMAETGDCCFRGWRFPEDPDATPITGGFKGITFHRDAYFGETTFNGLADFGKATFSGYAYFVEATFSGNVLFPLPPLLPFKPKPFGRLEDAIIAYRIVKQAAQDHGDYRMAGKYHFAEQCATNTSEFKEGVEEGSPVKIGAAVIDHIFAWLLFGYGERPFRPLCAAVFVIFLWAIFFWHFGGIEPAKPNNTIPAQETAVTSDSPANSEDQPRSFGECCYFSIVTFTTLGSGDMRPTDDLRHRLLAGSEALLGVAVMALFIVSLARKYTR